MKMCSDVSLERSVSAFLSCSGKKYTVYNGASSSKSIKRVLPTYIHQTRLSFIVALLRMLSCL